MIALPPSRLGLNPSLRQRGICGQLVSVKRESWIWSLLCSWIPATKDDIRKLMSKLSDYFEALNTNQDAQDTEIEGLGTSVAGLNTAVEGLSSDITELKNLIEQLKNTPGEPSAQETALMAAFKSRLETATGRLVTARTNLTDSSARLKALDEMTPPTPPPVA